MRTAPPPCPSHARLWTRMMLSLLLVTLFVRQSCATTSAPDAVTTSSTATTTIMGKLQLADGITPFTNMTKITLNNGEYTTYNQSPDGTFVFYNVHPGVHLLDVQSLTHMFSQVKIQLKAGGEQPKCIEYAYPGAPKQVLPCSPYMTLSAHAKYDYFEPRSKFNIMIIFKNPMMLMMIVSGIFMLFMPKLMENLEPEEQERMRKQMEMQSDPSKMLSSMFGDLMSGGGNAAGGGEGEGGGGAGTGEGGGQKKIKGGNKAGRRGKKD